MPQEISLWRNEMNIKTVLLMASALCTSGAMAFADTWKMQTLWPDGSTNQAIIEEFATNVETATEGEIKIDVYGVGTVVPFTETLQAVGRGILQAQHSGSVYFAGQEPALALIGEISGAYENPQQLTGWFYEGGGLELAREAYAQFNIFYVGPVLWGMESNPTKRLVEGVDDLKGLKIRTTQGVASELMASLGASPVSMAGSEVFSALDKGVIDAADWGTLGMNAQLGLHQVAKYELYPGFFQMPAADLAVNLDTWNKLSLENQNKIEAAVRDLNHSMISQLGTLDEEAIATAEEEGLILVDWPQEERAKFREAASKIWANWGAKSELAERVYESHMDYLRKIGLLD
jgi:TRAP-type mannitol/chloroaromatic compound transport system substrate-binding protein